MLYREIIAVCLRSTQHTHIYTLSWQNVKFVNVKPDSPCDKWVPVEHGMVRPHVADEETASDMEGSCEYIK